MLQQKKTFAQTMKLKRARQTARGFSNWKGGAGKGKSKGRSSVEDLKAVTRCGICKKVGHWHKECPERGTNKDKHAAKEIHHLQQIHETDFEEATFCGMLEVDHGDDYKDHDGHKDEEYEVYYLDKPAEQGDTLHDDGGHGQAPLHPAQDVGLERTTVGLRDLTTSEPLARDRLSTHSSNDTCDGQVFCSYKDANGSCLLNETPEHEILWQDTHHDEPDEAYCATIDTGCQRMAIGRDTLNKLVDRVPSPLQVMSLKQEHCFKSVHGKSVTDSVAAVPTSLGHRGSILRPAIFEEPHSRGAPFYCPSPSYFIAVQ